MKYYRGENYMKDINGEEIKPGDWIQGYNNTKHATDKAKLYPTKPMRMTEYLSEDIFELYHRTGTPWVWKLNIIEDPLDIDFFTE